MGSLLKRFKGWPTRLRLSLIALSVLVVVGVGVIRFRGRGFAGYTYIPSPHYSGRPWGITINCVVIHATVIETMEENIQYFLNPLSKVSTHFLVGKAGQVVQMVPVDQKAWHAGVSKLEGVSNVNDYSIGIELVNRNDGIDTYTDAQYEAVANIIRSLRLYYNIPDSRIVSHFQIALPVGRKSDPRGFDFRRLRLDAVNVLHRTSIPTHEKGSASGVNICCIDGIVGAM